MGKLRHEREFHKFPRLSLSVTAGSGPKARPSKPQGRASSHSGHGPGMASARQDAVEALFFALLASASDASPEKPRGSSRLTQLPRTESQRAEEQPLEKKTQECKQVRRNSLLKLGLMGEGASAAENSIHMLTPLPQPLRETEEGRECWTCRNQLCLPCTDS